MQLGSYAVLSWISLLADLRVFCANFRDTKMRLCYFLRYLHVCTVVQSVHIEMTPSQSYRKHKNELWRKFKTSSESSEMQQPSSKALLECSFGNGRLSYWPSIPISGPFLTGPLSSSFGERGLAFFGAEVELCESSAAPFPPDPVPPFFHLENKQTKSQSEPMVLR